MLGEQCEQGLPDQLLQGEPVRPAGGPVGIQVREVDDASVLAPDGGQLDPGVEEAVEDGVLAVSCLLDRGQRDYLVLDVAQRGHGRPDARGRVDAELRARLEPAVAPVAATHPVPDPAGLTRHPSGTCARDPVSVLGMDQVEQVRADQVRRVVAEYLL